MASAVLGVVLMVGTSFVTFGSLVAFATTNHYEKESCINEGIFQSIYDTAECPDHDSSSRNDTTNDSEANPDPTLITDHYGCRELLYEGSGIWLCPPHVTVQEIPEV